MTTQSGFTPGPWKADHRHIRKPDWGVEKVKGGPDVAVDHAIADVDEGPTLAESLANARLIASAPDLFGALKDLADCALTVNATQHAGLAVSPGLWAELYACEARARGVLAKVEDA